MQRLRGCGWVKSSAFPPTRVTANLVQKGWIESRGTGQNMEYRLTEAGMVAKTAPMLSKHEGMGRPRMNADRLRGSESRR